MFPKMILTEEIAYHNFLLFQMGLVKAARLRLPFADYKAEG